MWEFYEYTRVYTQCDCIFYLCRAGRISYILKMVKPIPNAIQYSKAAVFSCYHGEYDQPQTVTHFTITFIMDTTATGIIIGSPFIDKTCINVITDLLRFSR
jgi:hypothetical protein